MIIEVWRDIEGYEGLYRVSNMGRVRGRGSCIKPSKTKKGYLRVELWKGNARHSARIHRLVASAFVPNPHGKPDVNHIDGNKQNNRASNLEWVTPKENNAHAESNGLVCRPSIAVVMDELVSFKSINACARSTGIASKDIREVAAGTRKTAQATRSASQTPPRGALGGFKEGESNGGRNSTGELKFLF